MALIVRIDVDRPYGRRPLLRHIASRISSDYGLPILERFGYLYELNEMLEMLNDRRVAAHVFFRRCTLPNQSAMKRLNDGGHGIGLHLEDSRSYDTFLEEKQTLEQRVCRTVRTMSKHGSGSVKYGRRHHAPYEPEKYVQWARQSGVTLFLGNGEDPTVPARSEAGITFHPAAFWLEPHWRDCEAFTVDWLIDWSRRNDVVVLVHPENVLADGRLLGSFLRIVESCQIKVHA
jgi:hypothetical protein